MASILCPERPSGPLRGMDLRYVLTYALAEHGPMSVAELVRWLERAGLPVAGRPSKVVSDALRYEVRRGRVVRAARGYYAPNTMPRQTAWRIRRRVQVLVDAARTGALDPARSRTPM